jgi:hypothetical protein
LSIDLAAPKHERELPTLKTTVFPRFIVSWSTRFDVTQGQPISCFSSNLLKILRWTQGPRADVDIAIPAYQGSRATALMYNRPTHAFEPSSNCIATKAQSYLLMCTYVLSFLQDPHLLTDCSSEPKTARFVESCFRPINEAGASPFSSTIHIHDPFTSLASTERRTGIRCGSWVAVIV